MALSTINRLSTADVTITMPGGSALSYAAQFNRFGTRFVTPEIDVTTFASEENGETDQGASRCVVTYAGITKTGKDGTDGEAVHGELSANPPAVTTVWQFHTGASVSGTFNYNDHSIERIAGATSVFAGAAVSTGTYTVAWPIS